MQFDLIHNILVKQFSLSLLLGFVLLTLLPPLVCFLTTTEFLFC